MNKMKELNINELVNDFTQVITFKILLTIKNHYGSLESFKDSCRSKSNKELARYNKNFHIDSKILQALTRSSDGKRHLDEVLANLNPERLVYKHKYNWTYKKSNKKFSKPSTFYIPFKRLEQLFALADMEETPFSTNSGFYTERQHCLIDKHIFGFRKKERKAYTKTDKFMKSVEARKIKRLATKDPDKLSDNDIKQIVDDLDI